MVHSRQRLNELSSLRRAGDDGSLKTAGKGQDCLQRQLDEDVPCGRQSECPTGRGKEAEKWTGVGAANPHVIVFDRTCFRYACWSREPTKGEGKKRSLAHSATKPWGGPTPVKRPLYSTSGGHQKVSNVKSRESRQKAAGGPSTAISLIRGPKLSPELEEEAQDTLAPTPDASRRDAKSDESLYSGTQIPSRNSRGEGIQKNVPHRTGHARASGNESGAGPHYLICWVLRQ